MPNRHAAAPALALLNAVEENRNDPEAWRTVKARTATFRRFRGFPGLMSTRPNNKFGLEVPLDGT